MKVLVISDIHGNAEALRAVLRREDDVDSTIFLGDTVFPGPQVAETVDLLKDLSGIFIRGNHDELAVDPSAMSQWPEPWQVLYHEIFDDLDQTYCDFFRSLRDGGSYTVDEQRVCLQHGYVSEEQRHLLPDSPDELVAQLDIENSHQITLFGHSHIQFRRTIDTREFINPGSVGQNRCGHVIACYGILLDGKFEHRHVPYDPLPFVSSFDRLTGMKRFPEFLSWLKQTILTGFGVGEREPWTRFALEGYR